ncbi:MAG TPA: RNA polymerase sigma-70 factor [Sphingobacterium sp.]|nr:RNA polymerase sigma-70 factor [Sphingobacterium sp.]
MKPIHHDKEREMLFSLRQGDENAFAWIYHSYKNLIGARLFRLLKSEVLVEEVMQDVFMKVWENRTTIDMDKSFKSYLYRITENMVIDIFRRTKKEKSILNEIISGNTELYTHIEEEIFKKENAYLLDQLIVQMPDKRKKIFIACKLEGKSYQQVATECGIATTTVNDHLQKAMHFLRNKLIISQDVLTILIISSLFD